MFEYISSYADWSGIHIFLNTYSDSVLKDTGTEIKSELREKVILHEMGHAQKLAHPKQMENIATVPDGRGGYIDDTSVVALMNQGNPKEVSILTCRFPKRHDIINLKNKWE